VAETPEAAVKRQIRAILQAHAVYQQAPTTGGYGRSGALDFTVCVNGYMLVIEAKSIRSKYGHKGPTALQWKVIDEVQRAQGIACSIDETRYDALQDILVCLGNGRVLAARTVARETLDRHARPTLTPDTDTQPTKRKKP